MGALILRLGPLVYLMLAALFLYALCQLWRMTRESSARSVSHKK